MRLISFALTTPQFLARTKTVTRRMGWQNVTYGDLLCGIEKGQGIKKGETVKRLGLIRVVSQRMEPLDWIIHHPQQGREYGASEVVKEGFPEMTAAEFVTFFRASHKGCDDSTPVSRIEFEHVEFSDAERDDLRHMLGMGAHINKGNWGYRNYYAAPYPDIPETLLTLEARGYVRRGLKPINKAPHQLMYFFATVEGMKAVGLSPAGIKRALEP